MNAGACPHRKRSLLLLHFHPLLLLLLLLLLVNWIDYYLSGGGLPGREGSLLLLLADVADEDVKDEHVESAYVLWEQQPDDFLISILWAGKTKSKKEEWIGGGGGDGGRRCD